MKHVSDHLSVLFPPEVFCEKGVLRNFAKFTGKHVCPFDKVEGLRPANLLKKRLWHRCFPVNFAKFLRTPFFTELLLRLLLSIDSSRVLTPKIKGIKGNKREKNHKTR